VTEPYQLIELSIAINRHGYGTIYLLTAIGLTPGGSRTICIYTKTIYRTTQLTTKTTQLTTEQHN